MTLRGACRDQIIPRTLEDARMDRYRYRCPNPPRTAADLDDDSFCQSDICFPFPAHRENGRDFYDYEGLDFFYQDAHPNLRSRPITRPVLRRRAV